jgi:GT2 family glycosyltransferase
VEATVVIPHFGSVGLTWACWQSLQLHSPDVEVVVIDNGTGVDLPGRVIRNSENRGFAVACNQGAKLASASNLVFLNNDTEVSDGWLSPLLAALTETAVAAATPKLVYPDGSLQCAGVEIVAYPNGQKEPVPRKRDLARCRLRLASAACLAIRAEAFASVNGFDEGYWNGYEDIDLCLKLEAAGWGLVYEPRAVVMHRESQGGPERWVSRVANKDRLFERWGDALTPDRTTGWAIMIKNYLQFRLSRK